MPSLHLLVDYYSQAEVRLNRELSYRDHELAISDLIANAVTAVSRLPAIPEEINLRLYGGWFDEAGLQTQDRLIIGAVIRKLTPTRTRKTRILAECADSLWGGNSAVMEPVLPSTLRVSGGLAPFRVQKPLACAAGLLGCALEELESWKRGRCPRRGTCSVESDSVIISIRQKLVDSMLVCDQIEMSRSDVGWVVTASNDDDVIPALMVSARHSDRVGLIRIRKRKPSIYDDTLRAMRVHIVDVEV